MPQLRTTKTKKLNAAAVIAAALDCHAAHRARAYHAQKSSPNHDKPVRKTAGPRLPHGILSSGWRLAEAIALAHAVNVPVHRREEAQAELIAEAKAAFALWLATGPRRDDSRPRFRWWKMHGAALNLWRRWRSSGTTPASLLRVLHEACEKCAKPLAKRPRLVRTFDPSAWQALQPAA